MKPFGQTTVVDHSIVFPLPNICPESTREARHLGFSVKRTHAHAHVPVRACVSVRVRASVRLCVQVRTWAGAAGRAGDVLDTSEDRSTAPVIDAVEVRRRGVSFCIWSLCL